VVQEIALGQHGVDRITVRLASVFIGTKMPGLFRVDSATELDWDFVRPAGGWTATTWSFSLPRHSQQTSTASRRHSPRWFSPS
jgi:hypothetical protein